MKHFFILLLAGICIFSASPVTAQVAINKDGSTPDVSAMLDVKSTQKGLLIPRMTTKQRTDIGTPATGLMVYDSDFKSFWYYNGTAWTNLAGSSAGWSLTGNSGTVDGVNFIGTTDNVPLNFRVDNQPVGKLDLNTSNVFFGYQTGFKNTTGSNNIANGEMALYSNLTGNNNIANGSGALYNNTTGSENIANGLLALYLNTTGHDNIANGHQALSSNTTGSYNIASGSVALYSNTFGSYNIANGDSALYINTTGYFNIANGYNALFSNIIGSFNTVLGTYADVSTGDLSNATAIGYDAIVNQKNSIKLGNDDVTDIYTNDNCNIHAHVFTPSDARLKNTIMPLTLRVQFISMLKPVTYLYNDQKDDHLHSGFLAQDVEKAAAQLGTTFSGVYKPKTDKDYYGLSYQDFIMPLVNGMQQQQKMIEKQDKKISSLEKRLSELENKLNELVK